MLSWSVLSVVFRLTLCGVLLFLVISAVLLIIRLAWLLSVSLMRLLLRCRLPFVIGLTMILLFFLLLSVTRLIGMKL